MGPLAYIPSPSSNGVHIGPLFLHFYGMCYVVGITAAIGIARRRWRAQGGDPDLVYTVALWGVPAGVFGGRLYHDVTSWNTVPHNAWGWLAVWQGGLGIWGGIAGGAAAGIYVLRRHKVDVRAFLDAAAPALLVAQAIGRVGNYFNQELFGGPTTLPWGLEISPAHRPAQYLGDRTFQPSFLYELIFDLLLACALVWLGRRRRIRAPGLFALYVAGYSGYRIFEETLRVDPSHYILGERLNFWVACLGVLIGLAWFARIQWPRAVSLRSALPLLGAGLVLGACGCGRTTTARADPVVPAAADPGAAAVPPSPRDVGVLHVPVWSYSERVRREPLWP
ncbi:MAG TPA: prolipoprotein diacylglyceryl transferase [Solirubrobacteraceae bacterium]|nr:prolipoprotein diacylglyceryl transferase [Solirubrobacteraceae bacterium]